MRLNFADQIIQIQGCDISKTSPFNRFIEPTDAGNAASLFIKPVRTVDWETVLHDCDFDQQRAVSKLLGYDFSLEKVWWLNQSFRVFLMDQANQRLHYLRIIPDSVKDILTELKDEIRAPLFILMGSCLASCGGVVLHGSSFILDGHACMITGVSGAGKSTATNLLGADFLLSDDTATITGISNRQPMLHGTPLGGRSDGPAATNLAAIFFATKAEKFSLRKMSFREALPRILTEHRNYLNLLFEPIRCQYFSLLSELLRCTECYELAFTLNDLPARDVSLLLNTIAHKNIHERINDVSR